MNKNSQFIF